MNLVTNAVEAMPAGGRVVISSTNTYLDTARRAYEEIPEEAVDELDLPAHVDDVNWEEEEDEDLEIEELAGRMNLCRAGPRPRRWPQGRGPGSGTPARKPVRTRWSDTHALPRPCSSQSRSLSPPGAAGRGTPQPPRDPVRLDTFDLGGDFSLTAHDGRPFRLSEQRGKVVLLFFGYTSCQDVCPVTLAHLKDLVKLLGPAADAVQVLFVTVDPEVDTVEVLAKYLPQFDARFIGLSGTREQITQIAGLYLAEHHRSHDVEISTEHHRFSISDEITDERLAMDAAFDAPLAQALSLIIEEAVKTRTSDIHLEPEENRLRVRYRIDGILHEMMSLPLSINRALISRIKILSDMNIADHLRPQDGQRACSSEGARSQDGHVGAAARAVGTPSHGDPIALVGIDADHVLCGPARQRQPAGVP